MTLRKRFCARHLRTICRWLAAAAWPRMLRRAIDNHIRVMYISAACCAAHAIILAMT